MTLKAHKECLSASGWRVARSLAPVAEKRKAILAGGTALALRLGHRVSEDMDFFIAGNFPGDSLIADIRKTGLRFQVISDAEGALIMDIGGIKVSFFGYDYPFMEPADKCGGLLLAGLLDIASMKIIAVSQRGAKRDFIDIFFIVQETPFHKIALHMARRFGRQRINPVHIGKSLVYFADADAEPDPRYIKGKAVKWEKARKFFTSHVRQLVLDLDAALKEAG